MLQVNGLNAHYGLLQSLYNVNFTISPGETFALIGANGAGKSTLLRSLAGAIKVEREMIHLDGKAVGGSSEWDQLSRGIALVPEGRRLFSSLTVLENLLLSAKNGRTGKWSIDKLVSELPTLKSLLNRPSTALSGGQQQLVAIARSLVCNPDYLLCDEVSLGLSPIAVNEVYGLLAKVRQQGVAIILVEQNISRALIESDRYFCIQKGRMVLDGISSNSDKQAVAEAYFGI